MEMEPVSRHLGEHILKTNKISSYAVFVSTTLHRNVISDFRNRKSYQYYDKNFENDVDGLKILPLATTEISKILERGINYRELYNLFDNAHNSSEPVPTWYEKNIIKEMEV